MFPSEAKQRVPEQFWVVFATTKGDVKAIRDWAPIGVDRFFDLVEGMAVLDNLHFGYGDGAPRGRVPDQGRIQREGNAYLRQFLGLDYIKNAWISEKLVSGLRVSTSETRNDDQMNEATHRQRRAYIDGQESRTQPAQPALPVQESVLELLTYNTESHSYWFKVGVSEFDWCADYPFAESPVMEKVAADQFVFEGEQQLLEKFKSEKNMDVKMD